MENCISWYWEGCFATNTRSNTRINHLIFQEFFTKLYRFIFDSRYVFSLSSRNWSNYWVKKVDLWIAFMYLRAVLNGNYKIYEFMFDRDNQYCHFKICRSWSMWSTLLWYIAGWKNCIYQSPFCSLEKLKAWKVLAIFNWC